MSEVVRFAVPAGRRATTLEHLSHVGLQLFLERGFDATTVDDIADAAGIGRRTFFRYYPSKNDLPWGDFDGLIADMRTYLQGITDDVPIFAALRESVIRFNSYPPEEIDYHRERMHLLLEVPALAAHATLRYATWRAAVAEFVARRTGDDIDDLRPQVAAASLLAGTIAAYEQWLRVPDADLVQVLGRALDALEGGFAALADR